MNEPNLYDQLMKTGAEKAHGIATGAIAPEQKFSLGLESLPLDPNMQPQTTSVEPLKSNTTSLIEKLGALIGTNKYENFLKVQPPELTKLLLDVCFRAIKVENTLASRVQALEASVKTLLDPVIVVDEKKI